MKKITFTEKQKEIIKSIVDEKKKLQEEFSSRLNPILQKENAVLILICESHKVEPVQGIELKEDHMLVPVEEPDKKKK